MSKDHPLQYGGQHPISWGLDRTKRWRKGAPAPLLGWASIFSCPLTSEIPVLRPLDTDQELHPQPPVLSLWTRTGTYTTVSPGSQGFRFRLNYTTAFPGLPACRWQIVGPLSLYNRMSLFLKINLFLYIYIYPLGSVSLQNTE